MDLPDGATDHNLKHISKTPKGLSNDDNFTYSKS